MTTTLHKLENPCKSLQILTQDCKTLQNLAKPCIILQNLSVLVLTLQKLANSYTNLQNIAKPCNTLQNLAQLCTTLHVSVLVLTYWAALRQFIGLIARQAAPYAYHCTFCTIITLGFYFAAKKYCLVQSPQPPIFSSEILSKI